VQEEQFAMSMGRLNHIRLVLMFGIIPLFLACSPYVDLSETVLLSSDMSFEDPENEVLSPCQNELKVFVPVVSSTSTPLLPGPHFGMGSRLFSSSLAPYAQITPVLRC